MRIDEALRIYLSEFRLPGEAPLIFTLLEHFAARWRVSVYSSLSSSLTLRSLRNVIIFNWRIMMLHLVWPMLVLCSMFVPHR